MVVTKTDMILRYSGGLSNCNSVLSLGGMISTASCGTVRTNVLQNVFDSVSNNDLIGTIVGTYNYRCLYLFNANPANETLQNVSVWIELNTTSPFTDVDIGLGLADIGEIEQTIPNENTPPKFVAWFTARDESMALFIGNLPADKWKAIWIRRHAGPAPSGSSYPNDSYRLRYKCHGVGIPAPPPAPGPSPPSPPSPPPPGSPPPPPTPPPTGSRDVFDITKIYPDKVGTIATGVSKPWYMNAPDLNNNCFFDAQQTIQKNVDNSWRNTNPTVRFQIYISDISDCSKTVINAAVNGFLDSYNHDVWADRGYIYKSWDWRNVEFTCFFKIANAGTVVVGASGLTLEVRGVKHSSAIAGGCGGSAYKVQVRDDGNVLFTKKHFHDSSVTCGDSNNSATVDSGAGSLRGKWVGVKYMVWNYINPGTNETGVHMELWLDKDGDDTWQKVTQINDVGAWYAGMPSASCAGDAFCGGTQDQIISWASPICGISTDGYPQVDFKWSSVREIQVTPVTPPPPPPSPSLKLPISSITAKGHDGNVPANVSDGNLNTRWSHSPIPTWIKLNLGSIKTLTGVKIAWYNGTTRRMGFKVECENTGGANVVEAYTGTSSGTSTQLETYNFFTAYSRQYVTIHVLTNSNTGNLWGSITEVEVFGSDPGPIPPPPPPGIPPGPPPAPDLAKDVFNINKLYATKPGSTEWAATAWGNGKTRTISNVPAGCTKDPYDSKLSVDRAGNPIVTINGSGIMKTVGTSPRVVILGTWQNVESTVYARCPSSTKATGDFSLRSKTDHYCVSTGDFGGYIHTLHFNEDAITLRKEKSHAIGYSTRQAEQPLTLPANTWIGVKGIVYNLPNGHVKLETWIDTTDGANGGTWVKRTETIDDGTWQGSGAGTPDIKPCGGSAMRVDPDVTNGYLEFKKWTIREITPPS